jgi:hypothetical protein
MGGVQRKATIHVIAKGRRCALDGVSSHSATPVTSSPSQLFVTQVLSNSLAPMTDPAGIPALVDAIRNLHDCGAKHVETVHVTERAPNGELVWDGDVEVFDLLGHAVGRPR